MHTLRLSRIRWLPAFAALGLGLGCSATGPFREAADDPRIKTIASIGDRPVGSVVGAPSSSAVSDLEVDEPKRDPQSRVAGHVVDDRGEPVANALVRIADGDRSGGRVIEATTDRAGGFTLHGLRPGSTYELIAEYEDRSGLISGRAEVRPPQSQVEIALGADDAPVDRRRAEKAPAGRKVSDRVELDDEQTAAPIKPRKPASSLNREDIPDHGPVEDIDELAGGVPSTRSGARAVTVANRTWRRGKPAPDDDQQTPAPKPAVAAISDGSARRVSTRAEVDPVDDEPVAPRAKPAPPAAEDADDEGASPLPPAIDPDTGKPPGRDPDPATRRPTPAASATQAVRPIGPGTTPGAFVMAKDATTPAGPKKQKQAASTWSEMDPAWSAPAAVDDRQRPARVAARSRPEPDATPRANPPAAPNTWGAIADAPIPPAAAGDAEPKPRKTARLATPSDAVETCRYDANRRKILELRAPDVSGQLVSLADVDADLILIDFWGTWCRPCLGTIPHLVELQAKYPGKKLTIIGVACEEGPGSSSRPNVADVAKSLGINYQVLVVNRDEAGPIQKALHINTFPTMLLVDRSGGVLWRDSGATSQMLSRLDRVIASSSKAMVASRTARN